MQAVAEQLRYPLTAYGFSFALSSTYASACNRLDSSNRRRGRARFVS